MVTQVTPRNGQSGRRNVCGVDPRIGKHMRRQDGEAPGTRAEIKHRPYVVAFGHPWRETVPKQGGDVRAWHDHALVHVKRQIAEPRFARQVSGRFALPNALLEQSEYSFRGGRDDHARHRGRERVER